VYHDFKLQNLLSESLWSLPSMNKVAFHVTRSK
jgi:hypothetical protein